MQQGVKRGEEAVTSYAKQRHWGGSFRTLDLRTPLASLWKQVAPRKYLEAFLHQTGSETKHCAPQLCPH